MSCSWGTAAHGLKDDAEKRIATSRAAARQLEQLFEADAVEEPEVRRGPGR